MLPFYARAIIIMIPMLTYLRNAMDEILLRARLCARRYECQARAARMHDVPCTNARLCAYGHISRCAARFCHDVSLLFDDYFASRTIRRLITRLITLPLYYAACRTTDILLSLF